ncbi:hypothetical protein E8E12_001623 [Didymella heteroderae]|uniref:AAA+ ATPase domain-containing protein n=1 Tax=Didymella heteroderae TaxID=1769908 RepID=A0A9P4WKK5_9PLEO|nr:hypothetical protein E8E12_001623 [Didymella heteroderae]
MQTTNFQARADEEMDRLHEQLRRLEAQNASLEDRLARYIPPGPVPYFDRPPFTDRNPYYAGDLYFDRSRWADRYGPPPLPPPMPYSPGYFNLPPGKSAIPIQTRRAARDGVTTPRGADDSEDTVEGAKEADEKVEVANDTKAATDDTQNQKRSRIKTVINKWNEEQSKWGDIDSTFDTEASDVKIPATFRRHLDGDNDKKIDFEEVEIHSRELKDLLLESSIAWEDLVTKTDQSLSINSPFHKFVQHWDAHEKSCKPKDTDNEEVKKARTDLQDIMDLIKKSHSLKAYFRSRDAMKTTKRIKFEFLWTLFGHGTLVYGKSYMNEMQMFEVKTTLKPGYKGRFGIRCSAFDWDGSKFAAYTYEFYIKEYPGEVPINSLAVFPVAYYENGKGQPSHERLQQELLERGRRYVDLCTQEPATFQCQYEGTVLVAPTEMHRLMTKGRNADALWEYTDNRQTSYDDMEVELASIEITGRSSQVIVDNFSFVQSELNKMNHDNMPPLGKRIPTLDSDCLCPLCRSSAIQQWKSDLTLEPSEIGLAFAKDPTRLQLLPPRLLGFALKEKVWGQFRVNNLTKVLPKDDKKQQGPFWTDLELDKESKDLLWAFMQHHKVTVSRNPAEKSNGLSLEATETKAKAIDIIEGKGQGLVILLHGPPGVGKTLTAETIAITTGRPLLTVTVSEIGITANDAERSLTPVLAEAARWEAVLLMDEADVFVEERTKGDMERNAMVSVLLRCLEYYKGIIILTTNRAKTIDAALQSRVQLAIQYRDLTNIQKINIYRNKLGYIPDEEIEDRQKILESLEYSPLVHNTNKTNGRQIRNIVTYARALAASEGQKLTLKHLVRVDEVTSRFTESMKESFDRQRAKNEASNSDR